uniref:Glucagon / GIP / secretin / VIP family domain-containing protein n=1 Tax=Myotis lucifugus TaxID=59463 RepID=G1QDC2_MYOLU
MKSIYFVAALFVMLVQGSWQRSLQDTEEKSSSLPAPRTDLLNDLHQIHKEKRFTDEQIMIMEFNEFMQRDCVREFMDSMMKDKKIRNGIAKRDDEFERHAEGTFTSDLSSYLEGQAAKEFIAWLVKGLGRQELIIEAISIVSQSTRVMLRRRHVDGSFSDEMNTSLATLEFINWLLQNKITNR